jgi:hypothetical protein
MGRHWLDGSEYLRRQLLSHGGAGEVYPAPPVACYIGATVRKRGQPTVNYMWSDMAPGCFSGLLPARHRRAYPSARSAIRTSWNLTPARRTVGDVRMDYPTLPSSPSFQPAADQSDGLLVELNQVQVELGIAEYHPRLRRADSVTHETGGIVDRIAEMLRIEAAGTPTTPRIKDFPQVHAEASPTGHAARRNLVAIVPHVDSGGTE